MEPVEDIVSKLDLKFVKQTKTLEIDELLTVLCKHNVSEYNQDQFGLRVKFAADPSPESAMRVLQRQIEQAIEEPTGKTEPPGPPLRSVEPVPYNLEDILPGGA